MSAEGGPVVVLLLLLSLLLCSSSRVDEAERRQRRRHLASATTSSNNIRRRPAWTDGEYDWRVANASASLSAFAYCGNDTILAFRNYSGPVADLVPTNYVFDRYYDVHGYIGYSESYRVIFVVFRGSLSIKNWLDDFDTLMTSYPLCAGCSVHRGFHFAAQSVKTDVIGWTRALQEQHPDYSVVVTGHSLGGAMATLMAVELARPASAAAVATPTEGESEAARNARLIAAGGGGADNGGGGLRYVRHLSFGSPRVANGAAARYISSLLNNATTADGTPRPIMRTTHYRDIVPHNPFTTLGYMHVAGEWYEDKEGVVHGCTGHEDPKCADQWTFDEDIADHLVYLGQQMWCTAVVGGEEPDQGQGQGQGQDHQQ